MRGFFYFHCFMRNPFKHAIAGVRYYLHSGGHVKYHWLATVLVFIQAWWFSVDRQDWLWLILAVAIVHGFEIFNTAIESLCDLVEPHSHPIIKKVKDLSAAAVFFVSLFALAVALVIFTPLWLDYFHSY